MAIPIIGQTRTWRAVQFMFQPVMAPATIIAPNTTPEIMSWAIGYRGMRSDDTPVQAILMVDAKQLTGPETVARVLHAVRESTSHFETYRTCACVPNQVCHLHQQTAGAAS